MWFKMEWILTGTEQPPDWFIELVKKYVPTTGGNFAAQLFWQRGIQDQEKLAAFINYQIYQPADVWEFGQEMNLAVQRLITAGKTGEKIVIWGDFDADGITSTAVLWDGLGEFFQHEKCISPIEGVRMKHIASSRSVKVDCPY